MTINISSSQVYKIVQTILLVAILSLSLWSAPWNEDSSGIRKITVNGQSTIEAEPDEFVFYPYFQKTGTDKDVLKVELTETANKAVEKIKELGIEEKDIKLDASSYERWYFAEGEEGSLTVSLTIKTKEKEKAQEVQDYLLTLDVKGQISPSAQFSEAKKQELDKQAVESAIKDAREKADSQAKLLDSKLGKVIEIKQSQESIFPIAYGRDAALESGDVSTQSLPVLPGENKYTQTVTMVFELQ